PRNKRLARVFPNRQKAIAKAKLNVQLDGVIDIEGWSNWYSICNSQDEIEVQYNKKTYLQKNNKKRNLYLVANGTEANFHEITIENGLQARAEILVLELSCEKHGSIEVEFGLIEFGADFKRTRIVQQNIDNPLRYQPSAECRRFLPFIKVSGTGKCVINALYVSKEEKPVVLANSTAQSIKEKATEPDTKLVKSNLTLDLACALSQQINTSNGIKLYKKQPYSVAIITDEYMFNFYKDVFQETVYLTPDNYNEKLDSHNFDIILYVSCWKGLKNDEWRGIKFREKPSSALTEILSYAKENDIKTVFQTIEDPSNFEYFLPIAQKFDYIFTSDTDMIPRYLEECGHNNVFYGEYGVNPAINNPIDCRKFRFNNPLFAGSYARRYVERCHDTDVILDSLIESGIEPVIIDRNYGSGAKELQFPDKYKQYLYKPVTHEFLQKLHKLFRFNINLNSIKSSPTMCAMRVYELQAQCTNIISNYAKSTLNNFPNVRIVPTKQDLSFEFSDNESQLVLEYRSSIESARNILSNKCSFKIVGKMLDKLGLKDNSSDIGNIAVIYNSNELLEQTNNQSIKNLIPLHINQLDKWEEFTKANDIRYYTFFYKDNHYGKAYLEDMLNGFAYTNCSFITKPDVSNLQTAAELNKTGHTYTDRFYKVESTVFDANIFSPLEVLQGNSVYSSDAGYIIDPFNFNEHLLDFIHDAEDSHEYLYTIVVPTYNNGTFLLHKCIASLKRHNNWKKIEVIIVDDGSTDEETKPLIDKLCKEHSNIRAYFYDGEGSGSASRPRNKGVELATTNYIGFLDPDNEISPGGYDILYGYLSDDKFQELDFVSGYHAKIHTEVGIIGKHSSKELMVIDDPMSSFFEKGRFPVVPTQPALIKKEFLIVNNISYVEGAAGQDTLYGWEVLINAKLSGFTDKVHLIYYSERSDSITNVINNSYFDKKLILEQAQVKFLKQNNLLQMYLDNHFEKFMHQWYYPKANLAENKEYAENVIGKIFDLYKQD
ncbi:MAG: glycosyltransferase, partial [Kangiella sp.]|nr:glycosyltransferase [Kangiella sp.]